MDIFVGIDGTGTTDNARYLREFRNSFVRRLAHAPRESAHHSHYSRGPDRLAVGLPAIIERAYHFVRSRKVAARGRDGRILLTGYSRGAAAVIRVAQLLRGDGETVHAMMLFDCVDRSADVDSYLIPANVRTTLHVMRDIARSGSRESFSHSGYRVEASRADLYPGVRRYEARYFMGTHGALGGVPWRREDCEGSARFCSDHSLISEGWPDGRTWVTFERDEECAREVWDATQPFLRREGFL